MPGDEWGWNPSSFEATGTVAAAFIAVTALLLALREQRRNAQRETERYPRLVWVRWEEMRTDSDGRRRRPEQVFRFVARNRGSDPVFEPQIRLHVRHKNGTGGRALSILREPRGSATKTWASHWDKILGQTQTNFYIDPPVEYDELRGCEMTLSIRLNMERVKHVSAGLTFRDVEGFVWIRWDTGKVYRLLG